jgi:hypothetical protein
MQQDNRRRDETIPWIPAAVVVFIIICVVYILLKKEEQPVTTAEPPVVTKTSPELPPDLRIPEIKHPVPETPVKIEEPVEIEQALGQPLTQEAKPLPKLDESDLSFNEELKRLFDPGQLQELFLLRAFIRHFVVTIDNLTAAKLPQKFSITKPPAGKFAVNRESEEHMLIDQKNYDRYSRYVAFAEALDTRRLVSVYVRYYPLFQQAYRELGYPNRYFNDRLIEVIDHLLATPVVQGPIELVRPKVFYQFADPDLEALSAGRKILVRIGPDNAAKIKTRLRELRRSLTTLNTATHD